VSRPNAESSPFQTDHGLPERLARSLRHEVGDFLQKVYATVAILQRRVPADWQAEQDILVRLRSRAEACKHLVDAVQDFLCPVDLVDDTVDLAETAEHLVAATRPTYPNLTIVAESGAPVPITGDPARLRQVGLALLNNACESARQRVTFATSVRAGDGAAEWVVTDDGGGVPTERMGRLFTPFSSTRAGHAGLGLALARKLVELHGGRLEAGNLPAGGFLVRVILPVQAGGGTP
jgi:signal transduction histidine kinase